MLTRYKVTKNHDGMGFSNGLSLDDDGGYVSYSDYEKLKRAYDALADDITAAQGQIADAQTAQEQLTELRKSLSMAQASLVVWDIAYRTGRNEPLTHAFETGVDVLTQIRTLSDTKP